MIAKIAVSAANFAIDKPYSYYIPQDMTLQPGQRVMLPFGRGNKRTEGVVLSVEPGSADKLKAVESCLDSEPVLTEYQLRMAAELGRLAAKAMASSGETAKVAIFSDLSRVFCR